MAKKKRKLKKASPDKAAIVKKSSATKPKKAKKSTSEYSPKVRNLHLLGVCAVAAIALIPMLWNGFTNWDDILYVTENKLLYSLNVSGLKEIFSTPLVSNYHPFTVLSLALNYQISEIQPFGYHLTDLILHLVNTGLVYAFIHKLTDGKHLVAIFVALFFAIHPMHVESVAWVSERKDLLYSLFFLSGLITYLKYMERKSLGLLVVTALLFAASCMSKPAAVVFPVVMLLIDYYKERSINFKVILEKIPFFIIAVIFGIVALQIQSQKAIASLDTYTMLDRIQFAGYGFLYYVAKLFVPFPLSALHPFPVGKLNVLYLLAPFVSIGVLAFVFFVRKSRLWNFGILFYLVNVALVLQLLSVGSAVVAERYTYIPYIGLLLIIGFELDTFIRSRPEKKSLRMGLLALVGAFVIGFAVLTSMRTLVWKDSLTLWNDALKTYPDSHRAWTNRGLHFYQQKDYEKAYADIDEALKHKTNYVTGIEWRGKTALLLKKNQQALKDADLFIKYKPNNWAAHLDRAKALAALGRFPAAGISYNKAKELNPGNAEIINNIGVLYFNKLKKYQEALDLFDEAIALRSDNGMYYLNKSRCHYMLGQKDLAIENAEKAQSLGAKVDGNYLETIRR